MASQQKYTLPSEALAVRGVSIQDQSGNWHVRDPITLEEITSRQDESEFHSIPGQPIYYRPYAGPTTSTSTLAGATTRACT